MLLQYKGNNVFDKITPVGDGYEKHTLVTKRELELEQELFEIYNILGGSIFAIIKQRKQIRRDIRALLNSL